jgi:putative aldouronate transport system permease protein
MIWVRTHAIQETRGDKIFLVCNYVLLTLVVVIVLYPLIYILSSSFSSGDAVRSGKVWLFPVDPSLMGYKAIFQNPNIMTGYLNSIFYTICGTIISVLLTIMLAYPLSKSTFFGRNFIMVMLVFVLLFDGGLIPYYLTVKNFGLLDTRWAMIIPNAIAIWQVIITRTFFQMSIPNELSEAAELDGCSDWGFLMKVVVPLSKPIIAVLVLMYAVSQWNSYFDALLFLKSQDLFPLQIVLRNILILNSVNNNMMMNIEELQVKQGLQHLLKYSLIVVSSAPVLILYPFVQKHFVKGILIGSIKG